MHKISKTNIQKKEKSRRVFTLGCIVAMFVNNFLFSTMVYGQTINNAGHDFWAVFPTHAQDVDRQGNALPANFSIFITGGQPSSGIVTTAGFSKRFSISPNSVTEIPIPRSGPYINENESGQVLAARGIHIQTDTGQPPVVVYAHIFAGHRSAATLILPKEALGQSYLSINFKQHDTEGKNFMVIAAAEPNTRIHLTRGNTELINGGIYLANAGDVYEYLSTDDLTGVEVGVDKQTSACKHIAVFSGSSGIYISPKSCVPGSLDPLFQQCFPVESWGYHYGFIPFSTSSRDFAQPVRTAGQYLRVLAKDANTEVKINNKVIATLASGEYYTTPAPLAQASNIEANHPVCVAQYALSQNCSGAPGYSDPDMVILNPVEYQIKDITVYSSSRENISEQYLNVLISNAGATSFKINGVAPQQPFQPLTNLPGYSYIQLSLNQPAIKTFHLTANEGFNAIAYGFGNVESYAYSAGTNLAGSQSLQAFTTSPELPIDSACADEGFFFKLTLPYKSPMISWQMDAKETPTQQASPAYKEVSYNGVPSYEYRFPKTPAYRKSGLHHIHIISNYPSTLGGCENGKQEIEDDFYVLPSPDAEFSYEQAGCYNSISLKDLSIQNGTNIAGHIWEFGDPDGGADANISRLAAPIHLFKSPGTYIVKLTVINYSGCQSTISHQINISAHVKPGFTSTQPGCAEEPVIFTDESTDQGFGIAARKWLFGDGDSLLTKMSTPITHIYTKGGAYKVRLILINSKGCEAPPVSSDIMIRNKVKALFIVPSVCTAAPYARFINQSIGKDYTSHNLSYEWDFGDSQAGPDNPNKSVESYGVHNYYHEGTYTVTLVALTDDCRDTLRQNITVSNSAPKADFIINDGPTECAGQPVSFRDLSKVAGIGEKISRITWYFDATDDRKNNLTIDNPKPDSNYQVIYPAFYGKPGSRNYTVRLLAYSGTACVDSVSKEITITALPEVFFGAIPPVCISAVPVQIVQAGEANGQAGLGKFEGEGITEDGLFNPSVAGLGTHQITYKYINTAGCENIKTQEVDVVKPPEIKIAGDLYIQQGQSIQLRAVYSGENLRYHWSPDVGLDHTDIPHPTAMPPETTNYAVTISSAGCTDTKYVKVIVRKLPEIANAFTPNGDGKNDYWKIGHIEDYPGNTVSIFNRYGILLFHSAGYTIPWDGKYNASPVPAGTYYYVIRLSPEQKSLSGYVTVLR